MEKEFDPVAMDTAATEAEQELSDALVADLSLDPGINYMINWWFRWYMKTGHKRLGRMLVQMAKDTGGSNV